MRGMERERGEGDIVVRRAAVTVKDRQERQYKYLTLRYSSFISFPTPSSISLKAVTHAMADDQKHTPRPSAEGPEPGHHVEMMVRTPTQKALEHIEDEELKDHEHLPAPNQIIEDLGIPNWRELEKKVVRRLDMTLMPCLWVLYLFNYLDRASIA